MSALQRGFSTEASAMLSSSTHVVSKIFIHHHQAGSNNEKQSGMGHPWKINIMIRARRQRLGYERLLDS